MKKQFAAIAILAILSLSLVATFATISSAAASSSDDAELTTTPDNSNIMNVTGTDFEANTDVTITLVNSTSGDTVYTVDLDITTDENGTFTAIIIIPTSIDSGDYTIYADTDDHEATVDVTIPDLTGATGATGSTGATGATGSTGAKGTDGADGQDADPTLTYGAIGLGLLGLVVATYAVMRKSSK